MNLKKFYLGRALGLLALALLALIYFFFFKENKILAPTNNSPEQVFCTMEAKECPDGSFVGRTGPNCEFSPCPQATAQLDEAAARVIAEQFCIKGGEALGKGIYHEVKKTWSFAANLNSELTGCSPVCVVSEETRQASISWNCTGFIPE